MCPGFPWGQQQSHPDAQHSSAPWVSNPIGAQQSSSWPRHRPTLSLTAIAATMSAAIDEGSVEAIQNAYAIRKELLKRKSWLLGEVLDQFREFPVLPAPEERVKACIIGID